MRALCWIFLLFQVLFLNLVVPGHTRGKITLSSPSTPSCCESRPHSKDTPTPADRRACAVCYTASAYLPVIAVDFNLTLHSYIQLAHEQAVAQVRSLDYPTTNWPNGPPFVTA